MKSVFPILLLVLICLPATAQPTPSANSLDEVRHLQSALLLVFKSRVIDADASDHERAVIQDVLKADPEPKGRYRWVYTQLAKKLNKYIRKYNSLTAAKELSTADYVIFFNVVEFRRILDSYYPYGELFVIVKGSPATLKPPHIVWRAKKLLFAEDAMSELIRDLKVIRGES